MSAGILSGHADCVVYISTRSAPAPPERIGIGDQHVERHIRDDPAVREVQHDGEQGLLALHACDRALEGVEARILIPNVGLLCLVFSRHQRNSHQRQNAGILSVLLELVRRLIRLAFLAPRIVEATAAGQQPPELTAKALTERIELPLLWNEQERAVGIV
jgi:hypothetical protein